MKRYLAASVTLLALIVGALAQSNFTAPGGQNVPGSVQMCLNTASQAVPCVNAAGGAGGFPDGATPITANATGSTGAVTATLAAAANKFTYVCGVYVTGNTTTTANVTAVTIAGTITGSMVFNVAHPVSPALGNSAVPDFTPCVPSSAVNTAITVTSAADAAGVAISVTAWGYQL